MPTYICQPVVPMRKDPACCAEVVSQALFSEEISPIKSVPNYHLIQTPDGYTGWVLEGSFQKKEQFYPKNISTTNLFTHVYLEKSIKFGPLMTLPFGTKLFAEDLHDDWLKVRLIDDQIAYIQKGNVERRPLDFYLFCQMFFNLPYTWGGRSSFGFDCSGFVQMVYAELFIQLPRDSYQQALLGEKVDDLQLGDLIFWGYSEAQIRHVGMFLEKDRFIHTSNSEKKPFVRTSSLWDAAWKESGIYPYRVSKRVCHDIEMRWERRYTELDSVDRSARL